MIKMTACFALASLVLLPMSVAASPAEELDAEALYAKKCAMCHGVDGTAKKMWASKGARNFNDPAWQKEKTDDYLFEVTKEGNKEKKMPAFNVKLTDDQIRRIIEHIRTLEPAAE